MREIRDIHNYKKQKDRAIRAIENSNLSGRDKELIKKFHNFCMAEGLTEGRIAKHLWGILVMGRTLGKNFEQAKRRDIEELVGKLREEDYAKSTMTDFNITIKKFYAWLRKCQKGEYPPEVSWLSTTKKDEYLRDPSDDLTIEDVKRLAEVAEHPRDKALVWTLFETGARIGEFLNMRIKEIQFDRNLEVKIWSAKGVKKIRELPMIQARGDIATWLDVHPHKNNPDAMLWISVGVKNHNKPLAYGSVVRILRILAERAKITKPVNPHSFRHSRLSFLGDYLTDAQMCEFAGWMPGSKMSKVYVRPKRTKSSVLGIYGIKDESETKKVSMESMTCKVCTMVNAPESKYCRHCGNVIDMGAALSIIDKRKEYEKVESELYQRPEVVEQAVKALQQNDALIKQLKATYPGYYKLAEKMVSEETGG